MIITKNTEIGTMLPRTPHSLSFGHKNPDQQRPNPAVFITDLFSLDKHMAPYGRIPSTTTLTHSHTPIQTYPQ